MAVDQTQIKKQILEFSRDESLDNKRCYDCQSPHPQWASANNAVFLCIQCAGVHRGFGVHISFVRSVTMDTWKPEEVAKMKLGGNKAFRDFLQSYSPASDGGYREGMSANELYQTWAANQWREKLSKEMLSEEFTPSAPPPTFGQPSRPASSQSLRKSRASQRTRESSSLRSASPASVNQTQAEPADSSSPALTANENYFARMGAENAGRPDHLPPSQGGKYSGFGSTPDPPPPSVSPDSMALSSQNLPSFQDISQNPVGALSKGWSIFSTAVAGAGKAVNDNILQPGMERVKQETPGLQQRVEVFMGEASKRVGEVHGAVRDRTGVDVQDSWGSLMDKVKTVTNPGPPKGYSGVGDGWGEHGEETSALYRDDDAHEGDDFFNQFPSEKKESANVPATSGGAGGYGSTSDSKQGHADVEREGWDDWKEF